MTQTRLIVSAPLSVNPAKDAGVGTMIRPDPRDTSP